MKQREKIIIALCIIFTVASGVLHYAGANAVLAFGVTAGALALLAVIVGDATEQLGSRLGPGAKRHCTQTPRGPSCRSCSGCR